LAASISSAVVLLAGSDRNRQDNLQVYTQIVGLSGEEFIEFVQQGVFE